MATFTARNIEISQSHVLRRDLYGFVGIVSFRKVGGRGNPSLPLSSTQAAPTAVAAGLNCKEKRERERERERER